MSDADPRTILSITGSDAREFLQGLITNDVTKATDGLVYAAILSPQGKYLADFFVLDTGDALLLDVAASQAQGLAQRLSMYKLRADVTIADSGLKVTRGLGAAPKDAWPDPRHPDLGWRSYGPDQDDGGIDWTALRVALGVPAAGQDLIANDSYPLEMGFERLNGVDFRKGCYVGQEVTARMKHKTELRKGLATVDIDGPAEPGTEITAGGKPVGTLLSRAGNRALAYLRFDRAGPDMQAGEARVAWEPGA